MGNSCCSDKNREEVAEHVEKAVDQVQVFAADVKETAVEQVKETAGAAQEMVAHVVEEAAPQVAEVAEAAADLADTVQEKVEEKIEDAKELAADVADAAADIFNAAMAAAKGVMYVEFDVGKGSVQTVEFNSRALGFTLALAGCCVCGLAAKAAIVVVSKVDKNSLADKLGVKKGWAVKAINGTEVTGLEEARRLLKVAVDKIPEP